MIDIQITPAYFEYDVQSLVQAFYPAHPFKVNGTVEESYRKLKVMYDRDMVTVQLYDRNKKLFEEHSKWNCSGIFDGEKSENIDRRETKNVLKKLLYRLLSKDTQVELPWGNLTGIRPAKIPGMLFEQGLKEIEIRQIMKETYLISDEKLDLAMDIAKREQKLLTDINYQDGYSLYVGIPFCPTTCLYCSFTSYPISLYKDKADDYISALIKEIEFLGEKLKGRELNTVYIGGGTPTTLIPAQIDRLITALKLNFDFDTVKEFTVEAGRPDSITREKLLTLKKHNVSRISINPQTMNQTTLDIIGRKHTVEQVREAFDLARECGLDNINMDFIVGLPEENEEMVRCSMEEAMKLNPEGITVHSLAIKRASRLNIQKEDYSGMHMENSTRLMNITKDYAEKMGMKPYYLYRQKNMTGNQENVGYSKEGYEGLYNILMMGDYQNVWAVGAGAVTKLLSRDRKEGRRIDTLKNVNQYIERIDEMIARKAKVFETIDEK
ncbi:MAG: coproporphyrinogen dehydrogenase HemZ [Eubacterium sp.]